MATVDLNADCGESYGPWQMGDDAAIFEIVTSANVACGFHAGDPETMAAVLGLAKGKGVCVGAHPGFDDKLAFGRRIIPMEPGEITRMVAYQIGAMQGMMALAGTTMSHVKAHGALSNYAMGHAEAADAVAAAVKAAAPGLPLLAVAKTELEHAAHRAGIPVACEIFADRLYEPNGHLMSRKKPGAVVSDAKEAAERTVAMVEAQALIAHDGTKIPTAVDSICVHGDNPAAVAVAREVREALERAGIALAPFNPPAAG